MSKYGYERLSAQDNEFLLWERPGLPMHIAGLQIFELEPLRNECGGVDFEKIRQMTEATLHRVPRYRQRLAWIPGEEHAVWVDDAKFRLDYHIRHMSLPRPGTRTQLKQLMGRILEYPLDRTKPLWELWVIEGMEEDHFATVLKTHHCMFDGIGGVDLISKIFSLNPDYEIPKPPKFYPRPIPSGVELWSDEWKRRFQLPARAIEGLRSFYARTADFGADLARRTFAAGEMLGFKVVPASDTPLNGPVGPHRIFETLKMPFEKIHAIHKKFDCSINDVLLASVTGAVRDYMILHQVNPMVLDFRVQAPVSIRKKQDRGKLGNQVSSWIVRLPLAEEEPVEQLALIHRKTKKLKEQHQSDVVEMIFGLMDWVRFDFQDFAKGTANMLVTNIPGPQVPLYFMGSEMLESYPAATLLDDVGLAIGLFSYHGNVFWGLLADYDRVPDLPRFVALIERSVERLSAAEARELVPQPAQPMQAVRKVRKVRRRRRPKKTEEPVKIEAHLEEMVLDMSPRPRPKRVAPRPRRRARSKTHSASVT